MEKEKIELDRVAEIIEEVTHHLIHALNKFNWDKIASSHEALGIITEEYYELIEAIKNNNDVATRSELIDIAVAAIFGIL